jgi:hypothetical protein
MSKKCSHCNTINPDEANFCARCGKAIEIPKSKPIETHPVEYELPKTVDKNVKRRELYKDELEWFSSSLHVAPDEIYGYVKDYGKTREIELFSRNIKLNQNKTPWHGMAQLFRLDMPLWTADWKPAMTEAVKLTPNSVILKFEREELDIDYDSILKKLLGK